MSFVGTRPEVPRYTEQYSPEMMATLLCLLGLHRLPALTIRTRDAIISQMTAKGMTVDQVTKRESPTRKMHYNLAYHVILISDIRSCSTVFEVLK